MLPQFLFYALFFVVLYQPAWAVDAVHEFTLDNGMRILVKEDHRAPVAVSQVWYRVGASYEREGKTGLAHLLEHMMFKGTEKHGPGEFSKIMAAHGASENAFTSGDYTAYFQSIEKSRLHISFELEADRMRNLRLNAEEFEKERNVVIEERRMRTEDKPSALMYEQFMATAYQTSPYHNPVIGWMEDVRNLQLEDLAAWYQQWYAPNNATLVVVGDVNPPEVLALAQQYFGPLQPSPQAKPMLRPETPQFGMKRITVKRPAKVPSLLMGYKVPSLKTRSPNDAEWEPYALAVLAYVLDGGSSARLQKNLVRGQEIAASVSSSYDMTSRLEELFLFSASPAQGRNTVELEQAILAQIEVMRGTLVEEAELARVKAQLVAAEIYERDSMFYQGMKIGMLETVGLDYRLWDAYVEKISAVTPAQVQAVAQKYLVEDRLTVAELVPLPLDDDAPSASDAGHDQHIR